MGKSRHLPTDYTGGKSPEIVLFATTEVWLAQQGEQGLVNKADKYKQERRCLVCGELNCHYYNQRIHR